MRGVLIGIGVVAAILLVGFGSLVLIADGMEPEREEIRVELPDDFPN
ncbi:hypothetical protein [Hyphobacterium marinum]|uniref:Uncharacterized protein n=1 Tax=Hyphobacterium marinum TaxID=3116574 RepID=A0ABU7LXI2_9PROT|nr:hypothetical protein [Hyphobacterium sp. Y6023]MEE2566253.1 hypothetical protein [Hyphobacterium sp. Y6023]